MTFRQKLTHPVVTDTSPDRLRPIQAPRI